MKTIFHPNKRIVASLMAVLLVLSIFVPFSSATNRTFTDVPSSHWAYDEIQSAVADGIVTGYSDGTFKPANSVTNAHFTVMVTRAFYPDEVALRKNNGSYFLWYQPNMIAALQAGILSGTSFEEKNSDTLDWANSANLAITRYDMAQIMYNVMAVNGKTVSESEQAAARAKMADWNNVPSGYRTAVASCYALGLLNGYSDGMFHGDYAMNRAQGCVVVCRLKAALNSNSGNTGTTTPVTPVDPVKPSEPETPVASEGTLANGKAITEANVKAILADIKAEYPDGTLYLPVGSKYYSNALGYSSSADGCNGWAAMVSDLIFGKGTVNPPHVQDDHTAIRPGDVIASYNSKTNKVTHYWIATSEFNDRDDGGNFGFTSASVGFNIVSWTDADDMDCPLNHEEYSINGGLYWVVWTRYPD